MPAERIAFLVLAHRDARQLERLCSRLHPHAVFLHVDVRATDFPIDTLAALPNVTVVQPRIAVYWTDFAMVDATLTALRTARAQGPFDRYVLLSAECYPAKPVESIVAALAADPRKEWIGLTPITRESHLHKLIARHWRIRPLVGPRKLDAVVRMFWNKIAKYSRRDLQAETGLVPYFGNSWWALTDACIAMILHTLAARPELVRAYRSVYAPDEQLFHTVIGNSAFAAHAIPIQDEGAKTNQITPLHEVAPTVERYFGPGKGDFERVAATDKFFLRKVSSERSGPLLDRIDRELLHAPE